jgi:hypothetical protein
LFSNFRPKNCVVSVPKAKLSTCALQVVEMWFKRKKRTDNSLDKLGERGGEFPIFLSDERENDFGSNLQTLSSYKKTTQVHVVHPQTAEFPSHTHVLGIFAVTWGGGGWRGER